MTKKKKDVNYCDDKTCPSIKRIGELLTKYLKNDCNIYYNKNYSSINIYNDYNHILFNHKNTEMEDIMNWIKNKYQINWDNLLNCGAIRRNYRNRGNEKIYNKLYIEKMVNNNDDNNDVIWFIQFLDVIPSHIFHLFDMNYSLTKKRKKIYKIYGRGMFNNDDDMLIIVLIMVKLKINKILKNNKNRIRDIIGKTQKKTYTLT